LAVVLAAVLGRSLGVADFGLYYFITSTSTFVYVLVEGGQTPYVIREVARHPEWSGGLLGSAIALRLGVALILAVVTPVALRLIGYDLRTSELVALFIVTSLPFALAQGYGMIFRGHERMGLDSLVSVVNKALVLALTVGAFALHGGLPGAILAQGGAGLVALALAAYLLRGVTVARIVASFQGMRDLVRGGSPIVAMGLAGAVQAYLDVVILSKLAPADAVGWYGAARNIFGTVLAAASILGSAAYPRLARAAHDPPLFRKEFEAAMRPLLGMAVLAGVGSYLFADLAVGIVFGKEKFARSAVIIRAFAPGQALLFLDVVLATAILAVGRSRLLAMAKVVNLIIVAGLNVLLIPHFQARYGNGGIGVVVAFSIGEVVMFASAIWILPRGTFERKLVLDMGRALLAGAGTLALFHVLPPISPVIGLPLCILAFLALAIASGLLRRSELGALMSFARRR
jgi:O-antigen/teichoic acid export membrane protein